MMTVLILLGVFALGVVFMGTLNRRRSPEPVRHQSGRDSGDAYPVWAYGGDAAGGGADCDPGSTDCGSTAGGGAADGGGSGGE